MVETPLADELILSAERRALLAPKLRALIEELGALGALETPDLELVTARPEEMERDDER